MKCLFTSIVPLSRSLCGHLYSGL